jgi:hypothetical protein
LKLIKASTWSELRALEGFLAHKVPREEMVTGELVGEYQMPSPMEPCGLFGCNQPHLKGFIVAFGDGGVSHVGGDCGQTHFGATWGSKLKRLRNQSQVEATQQALAEMRAEAKIVSSDAWSIESELLTAVTARMGQFDSWPRELVELLVRMALRGDGAVKVERELTVAEQASELFMGRRSTARYVVAGVISGITAVKPGLRADHLAKRARELKARVGAMAEDSSANATALRRELNRLKDTVAELHRSCRRAQRFFVRSNGSLFKKLEPTFDPGTISWLD